MLRKIALLVLFSAFIQFSATSASVSTVKDGNWSDPTVWSSGAVPVNGDDITINHHILIDGNYDYSSSSISTGWSGYITLPAGDTLYALSFTTNNGNTGSTNIISGLLYVYGDYTQGYSTTTIEEGGKIFVNGTYSTGGGDLSVLTVNGTLEVGALNNGGSAQIIVGPNGKIIVHGDYNNTSSADIILNGGSMTIEGSYVNSGDGTITLNDGASLYIEGDLVNTGGSQIVVNNGAVVIDGNVDNQGGSTFEIADGSYVEVNGDFTNRGGGTVTVDGSLDIEGTLENTCGGNGINGNGSIIAGQVTDCSTNPGIDPDLLTPKQLYSIGSGEWTNTTIWSYTEGGSSCNCSPPVNSIVTISTGNTITLNSKIKIEKLMVNDGATIILDPEANLILTDTFKLQGTLILKSDRENSANFVDNGTIVYGANSSIISKVFLTGNAYHYISSYIPGVSTDILQPYQPNVYQYDETAADDWLDSDPNNDYLGWIPPNSVMNPTDGYAVFVVNDDTLTINGTKINTGTYQVPVTYTQHTELTNSAQCDGWNLIANPYPSSIDAVKFLNDNSSVITGNVYIWIDDHSQGDDYSSADYMQINVAGTIIPSESGVSATAYIPPNQAFFVQATTNGIITFNNTQRADVVSKLKSSKVSSTTIHRFKLGVKIDSTELYNETLIAFSPDATDGMDLAYDGIKRIGNSNLALYSLLKDEKLGIQTFGDVFVQKQVPIGLIANLPGNYVFTIKDLRIPSQWQVELYDAQFDKKVDIKAHNYTVYLDKGEYNDRFSLIITNPLMGSTPVRSEPDNAIKMYSTQNKVIIDNQTGENLNNALLNVISLDGRTIISRTISIPKYSKISVHTELPIGTYIVSLISNTQTYTQKVIIR